MPPLESWEVGGSGLHSSYLFIGAWFIEGLAGITQEPSEAGFQHFVIRPLVDTNPPLDHAAATLDSLYGRILSAWFRKDGHLITTVTVPPNSQATLYLPAKDPETVREGGKPLKQARGVKPLRTEPGHVVLALQSDTYRFESK